MVTVNQAICIGCGQCELDCVGNAIWVTNGKAEVKKHCIKCGHCVAICPVNAVAISDYDMKDVEEYREETFSLSPTNFLNAVKFRRSIRKFQEQKIEKEKLERIIEAGRYTATAVNAQAVHYVVVQEGLEELKPLIWKGWLAYADTLPKEKAAFAETIYGFYDACLKNPKQDRLFFEAPALLVVANDNVLDDGLAAQNMEMMAVAEGLGALYNGYVLRAILYSPEAMEWLGLTGKKLSCCMLLGYPDVTYKRTAPRKKADVSWK